MIPIDRTSKDPFFRYKMPPVQVVHDSSRTTIANMEQIAKSLYRNPIHILKFLSIYFGCNCIHGQKCALNGNFEASRVQSAIFDFIDLFVLCKKCRNPETRFIYDTILKRSCNSCGEVFIQDGHKLNVTISRDKSADEDTKYDKSNKLELQSLFKDDACSSNEVYNLYKQENWKLEDIFSEYIKSKDLKHLSLVLKEYEIEVILSNIEDMIEMAKKEDKIDNFIKALIKLGFSSESIEEYFSKPRIGRKRSPLLKKNVDFFFKNE